MRFALALFFAALPSLAMAEDVLRLELNTTESLQNRCRMSYLIENKSDRVIDAFKLDLVILGTENTMQRRMVVDIAPVRAAKTIFRTYEVDRDCGQIGAVLVNDVQACTPGDPSTCLDRLDLSSRVSTIRLFK
jgi:hypothetical protein